MKRLLSLIGMLALLGIHNGNADIVTITTSCGKVAYIDSNRTPNADEFWEQVARIEKALCTEDEDESDPIEKP